MGGSQSKNPFKEAASLLDSDEISILRKIFSDLASRSEDDVIDKQTFLKFIPLPGIIGERLFSVVDQDGSGIDLEEFLCCVAILTKGSREYKIRLLYSIYNLENHKSGICTKEFVTMMNTVFGELAEDKTAEESNPQGEVAEELSDSEINERMKKLDEEIDEEIHSAEHKRLSILLKYKHELEKQISSHGEEALEQYRRSGETINEICEKFAKDIVSECDSDKSGRLSLDQFSLGVAKYPLVIDSVFSHPSVLALNDIISKSPQFHHTKTFVSQTPSEPQEPSSNLLIHGFLYRQGNLFKGLVKKYYVVSEGFIYEYKSEQAFTSQHSKPTNVYFLNGASIAIPDASNLFSLITKRIEKIDCIFRDQEISPFEAQELLEERKNLLTQEKTIHEEEQSHQLLSPPEFSLSGEDHEVLSCDEEKKESPGSNSRKASRRLSRALSKFTGASSNSNLTSPPTSPSFTPIDINFSKDYPDASLPPLSPKATIKPGLFKFNGSSHSDDGLDQDKFEFRIILPHKTLSFYLDSDQKRSMWVRALEKAAKIRKVEDYYHILYEEKLGVGCFANVYACEEISTGAQYAVKVVDKTVITESEKETLETEISCMKLLHHTNIVSKKDVFETQDTVYIVMEKLTGGTILEQIEKYGRFSPERAKSVTHQILSGVLYIHNAGVLHRDLKPSNIIFVNESEHSIVKILDFGLSTFSRPNQMFDKPVGTLKYFAPELIKEHKYNNSVDMWCIGVILYNMLVGKFPFLAETEEDLLDNIEKARFECECDEWKTLPEPAKDLIRKLLKIDPRIRITAGKALEHEWFKL